MYRRLVVVSRCELHLTKSFSSTPALCSQLPRISFDVADAAVEKLNRPSFVARKHHPGAQLRTVVCLPTQFVDASKRLLTKEKLTRLKSDAEDFDKYLYSRQEPIEKREYRMLVSKIEAAVKKNDDIMSKFLSEQQLKSLDNKHTQEIRNRLKRVIYHWKPINYDEDKVLQYLMCRSAPEYAVLYKIFHEIVTRDPEFEPYSLLDFGSGLSTALWAANAFWSKSLKEKICVDSSSDMNDIAEYILRGCNKNKPLIFPNTFYRQFLPQAHNRFYDVVTSAFSLLELPSAKDRINTLNTLWRKCSKYLIIVERGNRTGFKAITEARDFLMKLDREQKTDTLGHIFSPCSHDTHCPRVMDDPDGHCRYGARYRSLLPFGKEIIREEKYSYIVLKRESRNQEKEIWPRLVNAPLLRSKHVICRLCMPDGKLSEAIVTKSKVDRNLYRTARTSKWGDLFPIKESMSPPISNNFRSRGQNKESDGQEIFLDGDNEIIQDDENEVFQDDENEGGGKEGTETSHEK